VQDCSFFFEAKIKEKQETEQILDFLADLSVPEWDHNDMSKFVNFVCQIAEERGIWRRVHHNWLVVMRTKGVEPLTEPVEPDWKSPPNCKGEEVKQEEEKEKPQIEKSETNEGTPQKSENEDDKNEQKFENVEKLKNEETWVRLR